MQPKVVPKCNFVTLTLHPNRGSTLPIIPRAFPYGTGTPEGTPPIPVERYKDPKFNVDVDVYTLHTVYVLTVYFYNT